MTSNDSDGDWRKGGDNHQGEEMEKNETEGKVLLRCGLIMVAASILYILVDQRYERDTQRQPIHFVDHWLARREIGGVSRPGNSAHRFGTGASRER